jgi:hypothetical protein
MMIGDSRAKKIVTKIMIAIKGFLRPMIASGHMDSPIRDKVIAIAIKEMMVMVNLFFVIWTFFLLSIFLRWADVLDIIGWSLFHFIKLLPI